MSDLAPLLAAEANLRNKAVNDAIMEEPESQQLRETRVIQIINGTLYARSHVACKEYGNATGPQWLVKFSSEQQSSPSPPLSLLREMEIKTGRDSKVLLKTTSDLTGGYLVPDPRDHDNGKVVKIFSSNSTTSLWVSVMIHGWPRAHWEEVMNQGLQLERKHAMHYIYGDLAAEDPQKTFTFLEMTFVFVEDFIGNML